MDLVQQFGGEQNSSLIEQRVDKVGLVEKLFDYYGIMETRIQDSRELIGPQQRKLFSKCLTVKVRKQMIG
jgi:hypothetical protein